MSEFLLDSWQQRIVWEAVAAGSATEDQGLLLLALYRHADHSTRVISDFRAERVCEWLGKPLSYTRAMQRRLKELREAGWFEWTYRNGSKVPYDLTMRRECEAARHRPQRTAGSLSFNTLDDKNNTSPQEDGQDKQPPTVQTFGSPSAQDAVAQDGGAPPPLSALSAEVLKLRARVYAQTGGEMLGRVLTPSQTSDLLDRHSVDEICYAIDKRLGKVSDKREFHRSFRSFLLDGGIQIELDAARLELKARLNNVKGWFRKYNNGQQTVETPADRVQRLKSWFEANADEFEIFAEVGYDAAALVYSVGPGTQRQPNSPKMETQHAQVN